MMLHRQFFHISKAGIMASFVKSPELSYSVSFEDFVIVSIQRAN